MLFLIMLRSTLGSNCARPRCASPKLYCLGIWDCSSSIYGVIFGVGASSGSGARGSTVIMFELTGWGTVCQVSDGSGAPGGVQAVAT